MNQYRAVPLNNIFVSYHKMSDQEPNHKSKQHHRLTAKVVPAMPPLLCNMDRKMLRNHEAGLLLISRDSDLGNHLRHYALSFGPANMSFPGRLVSWTHHVLLQLLFPLHLPPEWVWASNRDSQPELYSSTNEDQSKDLAINLSFGLYESKLDMFSFRKMGLL